MMPRTLRLSDGAQVRLLEAGEGEPLVLLHGVGLRAEAWGPQIAALSRSHRVVAADLPGHGASDPLPGKPDLAEFVGWATRVIEALSLGPVSLAGHSMGALVAAGVTVERPDLVRRLAILNGVYRRSSQARSAVQARAEEIARGSHDVTAPLARWFDDRPADRDARGLVEAWLRDVDPAGYATAYRAFAGGDGTYADRWSRIGCPVLVLTGEGDPNSTAAMALAMSAQAPRARAVVVEGHRHMVSLTAPEAVTTALTDWLATDVQPARAEANAR